MIVAHEGQHWEWNHCPRMPPLLLDMDSWRSTLKVKSLTLNASSTIWQWLVKVNTGNEITVLEFTPTIWQWIMKVPNRSETTVVECLPYYMTVAHEGQYLKWNHCPWIPPLLYDRNSWRSTLKVKSLTLNASSTIWQWLVKVNTGNEITVLEFNPTIWQWIMKIPSRSETTVLECLPY